MDSDDDLFKLSDDTSALDSMAELDDINVSIDDNSNNVSESLRSLESFDDIKSTQVKAPQVTSTQVKASQVKSPQVKAPQVKFTEVTSTQVKASLNDRFNEKFDQMYSKHISKKNSEDTINHSQKSFNRAVILAQFIVLITLLVVAIINSNVEFISTNPGKFIRESTLVGASAACTVAVIGMHRMANQNNIFKSALLVFFIFFVIHVLMEFSGMYGLMYKSPDDILFKEKDERDKQLKNIQITNAVTGTVVGLIALAITPIILRVWHFKSQTRTYAMECITFAILNAIPVYIIDKNRGASDNNALAHTAFMGASFGALYVGLQGGGLINSVFSEPADLLNDTTQHPMHKN